MAPVGPDCPSHQRVATGFDAKQGTRTTASARDLFDRHQPTRSCGSVGLCREPRDLAPHPRVSVEDLHDPIIQRCYLADGGGAHDQLSLTSEDQ